MAGSPYIVTQGIVLRETQTKESDKILTLLTPERGKLSVIARGVRRKSCRYAACAQALVWSEWTLYHRGDWYYVNEGATLELFSGLREDLEAMALGFYFAELTEAVTAEEVPAPELTRHLLNGLYAVSALHKPKDLVKAAFELRLLQTPAPIAAGKSRKIPCWMWCRVCCIAAAALRQEPRDGCPCPCVPTPWRPCGILCTEIPSGCTASGWAERLWSGSAPRRRRLPAQLERGFRTLDFYKGLRPAQMPSK